MKMVKKNVHTLCSFSNVHQIVLEAEYLLKNETGVWSTAMKLILGSFPFADNP
jgi:hypothetical protein